MKLKDADSIQIVDFEYGGFNFVGFDLANHFCEYAGFDFDLDRWYPNETAQVSCGSARLSFLSFPFFVPLPRQIHNVV